MLLKGVDLTVDSEVKQFTVKLNSEFIKVEQQINAQHIELLFNSIDLTAQDLTEMDIG